MNELGNAISALINDWGPGGLALGFCIYFLTVLQKKLDKLIQLNSKMFGVILAMSRKNISTEENDE
jgi:hypothetical protein